MTAENLRPHEESLEQYTDKQRKNVEISWYRTPLPKSEVKDIYRRSDAKAFVQAGGYLAIYAATAALAIYSAGHFAWWQTVLAVFLHGTVAAFMINGVHELGHGTVFKTRWLNKVFVHILAFLGWINHEMFEASHARHHRYTLHPPDDLEVVLPIRLMIRHFFKTGFIRPREIVSMLHNGIRIARGKFEGEWENTLFPASAPKNQEPPIRWARILLLGHGTILIASLLTGYWIVPVVITLTPLYGGWLFFLCNNTQHIGLQDNVPDFRLCCRTFTLNPVLRFLYWQMNYHTEHHMYAAVPCYNLGKLHRIIKHELPPTPNGLYEVWHEIAAIQARQEKDRSYEHDPFQPAFLRQAGNSRPVPGGAAPHQAESANSQAA